MENTPYQWVTVPLDSVPALDVYVGRWFTVLETDIAPETTFLLGTNLLAKTLWFLQVPATWMWIPKHYTEVIYCTCNFNPPNWGFVCTILQWPYNDPWFFVSCDKLNYVPFPDFCGKGRFRFGFPEPKRCQWPILVLTVLTAITGKGANPSDKVNVWWGHPFMLKGMLSVDPWMFGTTYHKKTMNLKRQPRVFPIPIPFMYVFFYPFKYWIVPSLFGDAVLLVGRLLNYVIDNNCIYI